MYIAASNRPNHLGWSRSIVSVDDQLGALMAELEANGSLVRAPPPTPCTTLPSGFRSAPSSASDAACSPHHGHYQHCDTSPQQQPAALQHWPPSGEPHLKQIAVCAQDSTLVIACLDHGQLAKDEVYEGGARVALMARFPAAIAARAVVDTAVINLDIAPTILEAVGAPAPAYDLDGVSWWGLATGAGAGAALAARQCLVVEIELRRAVICGQSKLLSNWDGAVRHPELRLNIPKVPPQLFCMSWCPDFEFRGARPRRTIQVLRPPRGGAHCIPGASRAVRPQRLAPLQPSPSQPSPVSDTIATIAIATIAIATLQTPPTLCSSTTSAPTRPSRLRPSTPPTRRCSRQCRSFWLATTPTPRPTPMLCRAIRACYVRSGRCPSQKASRSRSRSRSQAWKRSALAGSMLTAVAG